MNPAYSNCRKAARVRPSNAEVLFDDPPVSALMPLIDLSPSGALVQGEAVRSVGRRVRLVLLFPDGQRRLIEGRVIRSTNNGAGPVFAVGFERVSAQARRLLNDTVNAELKRQISREQPAVLVVDGSSTVSRFVCDYLGEYGAVPYAVATALDAINWLVGGERGRLTVYVGNPAGSSNAFELTRFVTTHFPNARVVLLVERATESPLMRGDGGAVTSLEKPWTPARLASFLLPYARLQAASVRSVA